MTNTSEPPADAQADASPPARRPPRPPSLVDALLPIVVLIGLLALTIVFFGIDATNGPLQVALFLSAAFAALVAFKNGYTVAANHDAAVGGVTTAMSAIFILLAVGALIGTWNMAGTIPTVVDYGIRLVSPTWFYVTTAVICALVGMVTGSSWTTAGTLGVAFIGMAKVLALEEPIAAGAVICGAYFGDKMTPLSETTILVPQLVDRGLTTGRHIKNMFWTAGPALGISLVIFVFLGLNAEPEGPWAPKRPRRRSTRRSTSQRSTCSRWRCWWCSPSASTRRSWRSSGRRCSPGSWPLHPVGGRHRLRRRPRARAGRHRDQGQLRRHGHRLREQLGRGADRRSLLPRGMASFLTTVWLILGALAFAAVLEHAGFLQRLLVPIVTRVRRRGSLILATNASGVGLNVVAGDQYVACVLPPACSGVSSSGAGWLRRCCPERSRTQEPSPRCWCPGTPAAPTSPGSWASPRRPTSRSASSTSSAPCSMCCSASSDSRSPPPHRRRRRRQRGRDRIGGAVAGPQ